MKRELAGIHEHLTSARTQLQRIVVEYLKVSDDDFNSPGERALAGEMADKVSDVIERDLSDVLAKVEYLQSVAT